MRWVSAARHDDRPCHFVCSIWSSSGCADGWPCCRGPTPPRVFTGRMGW